MNRKHGMALLMMLVLVLACSVAQAADYFTVTFKAASSTGEPSSVSVYPATLNVSSGTPVAKPTDPSVEGYTFGGWYTDQACTDAHKYDFTTLVIDNLTLYAKWTKQTFTVTFDLNGDGATWTGTGSQTVNVLYNESINKPANPSRTGYTFGGWYKEPTCTRKFTFDSTGKSTEKVTSDIKLYAKWNRIQYTVIFNNGGHGVTPAQQKVYYGDKVMNPGDLVEQGWKFEGWFDSDDNKYTFGTTVTASNTTPITLTAKWTPQYKVTFNMNGHGSVIASQTVTEGETAQRPKNPQAEGYEFDDWYTDNNLQTKFDFFNTPINSPTTVYAKWTATVTVEFKVQTTNQGSSYTDPAIIQLLENGYEKQGFQIPVDVNTTGKWKNLEADKTYTVAAKNVPDNYTAVCTRTAENTFRVTYVENSKLSVEIKNTHIVDKIDMAISKLWDDNNNAHRPDSVDVKIKKRVNGNEEYLTDSSGNVRVFTLKEDNQWTVTVTDLYMRESGTTIQYFIEEIAPNGYQASCQITVDAQGNYTAVITNVLTGKLDIDGKKFWDDDNNRDGIRPDSVQLKIYENVVSDATLVKNVIVTYNNDINDNPWSWTVEDLPVYDKQGNRIIYIVVEDPVPGYTVNTPQIINP